MKVIYRMTWLMVFALISLVSPYGQSLQDSSQEEPIVVSTNLVTVNVIVTDNQGRYVKGLKSNEFSIYDENVRQKIAQINAPQRLSGLSLSYRKDYQLGDNSDS